MTHTSQLRTIFRQTLGLMLFALAAVLTTTGAIAGQNTGPDNGVKVQAGSDEGSTVRLSGTVINAASGPGARAQTNIGSRSVQTQTRGNGSATITIESQGGETITEIITSAHTSQAPLTTQALIDSGRDFVNADLSGRNFAHANLAGRKFTNVNLSNANLAGADLRNAHFVNVDLSGTDLSGANLTGARLINTNVAEAITTGVIWEDRR